MAKFSKIFIFAILLSVSGIYSQQHWIRQATPTDKYLYKCEFADSLYGWVIGEQGVILHTTNGGTNWNMQNSGVINETLQDFHFIDRNTGWVVFYNSLGQTAMLHTTNSGNNWVGSIFPDTTALLSTIYFLNSATGFLGGYSGFYKTTNTGANWFSLSADTAGCFYSMPSRDIRFVNALTGYACGGIYDIVGVMWSTTNGGQNWFSSCVSPEPLSALVISPSGKVIAMGGDFEFGGIAVQPSDTGWDYDNIGCFGDTRGFSFRTPAEVWAALSFSGYFAVNVDSMKPGSHWECIQTPDSLQINDVKFADPRNGWCVGFGGSVYKYNKDLIGIAPGSNNIPRDYYLYQNYPNPFNPVTVIKYSLPKAEQVTLTLYDITGREISIFSEGIKQRGEHSIEINAGELASGVYFYTLTAGKFTQSRKMAVIK